MNRWKAAYKSGWCRFAGKQCTSGYSQLSKSSTCITFALREKGGVL